jgi:hypothetical protein
MKSRPLSRLLVPVCLVVLLGMAVHLVSRPARAAERSPNAPSAFQVGDVFVGVGTGKIKRFSPTGVLLQTLDTLTTCSEDLGMAFDTSGNLYATAAFGCSPGTVTKFDVNGNRIGSFGGGYSDSTESITLDAAQNVFVGQPDGTRRIRKFNSAGVFQTEYTVAVGPRGTDWIDMAADQCTIFYSSEGASIRKYNTCTSTQLTDFCTACPSASAITGMRLRANGEVFGADFFTQVRHYSAAATLINSYSDAGLSSPFAVNLDPDGTTLWTAGYNSAQVFRFNIATGAKVIDWNAGKLGCCASGLAVFGELVVGLPTPTPQGPTPTPTVPVEINPLASNPVPTLQVPAMAILGLLLAAIGILLMRRVR